MARQSAIARCPRPRFNDRVCFRGAAIDGVRLLSLQRDSGTQQLANCPFPVEDWGSRLDEGGIAFRDTAAVIQNLDLVITCDTALASGRRVGRASLDGHSLLSRLASDARPQGQSLVSHDAIVPPVGATPVGATCS